MGCKIWCIPWAQAATDAACGRSKRQFNGGGHCLHMTRHLQPACDAYNDCMLALPTCSRTPPRSSSWAAAADVLRPG